MCELLFRSLMFLRCSPLLISDWPLTICLDSQQDIIRRDSLLLSTWLEEKKEKIKICFLFCWKSEISRKLIKTIRTWPFTHLTIKRINELWWEVTTHTHTYSYLSLTHTLAHIWYEKIRWPPELFCCYFLGIISNLIHTIRRGWMNFAKVSIVVQVNFKSVLYLFRTQSGNWFLIEIFPHWIISLAKKVPDSLIWVWRWLWPWILKLKEHAWHR